jgi:Ni/Co efflux regulator RcnB
MRRIAFLLLAAALLAQGTALAQGRERQDLRRQEMQPRGGRENRESFSRERAERHQQQREHRFTREERDKLRQDLMDANREMRGRRGRQ